jgi:hypothetical protein
MFKVFITGIPERDYETTKVTVTFGNNYLAKGSDCKWFNPTGSKFCELERYCQQEGWGFEKENTK